MTTLLISLYERHCKNILNGLKTIELRKTKPTKILASCSIPCTVLFYETSPTSAIVGLATITNVIKLSQEKWCVKHKELCLTPLEICGYLNGEPGYGLKITNPQRLKTPILLNEMKKWGIIPPQGYYYLSSDLSSEMAFKLLTKNDDLGGLGGLEQPKPYPIQFNPGDTVIMKNPESPRFKATAKVLECQHGWVAVEDTHGLIHLWSALDIQLVD